MKRKYEYFDESEDKTIQIGIDSLNQDEITSFLTSDIKILKRFQYVITRIKKNLITNDIYGREDINTKAKDVTAMKLTKGTSNIRIYCKEIYTPIGKKIIIMSELLTKKKTQKNGKRINSIIDKIASYEY